MTTNKPETTENELTAFITRDNKNQYLIMTNQTNWNDLVNSGAWISTTNPIELEP